MRDFIEATAATDSRKFYGERVGYFYFLKAVNEFIEAGNRLDAIKKTLFYGKLLPGPGGKPIDKEFKWGGVNLGNTGIPEGIIHGILGVATEGVELVELLKATVEGITSGEVSEIDTVNLKEETGDVMWYLARLFEAVDTDFHTEARRVIAKLMLRYPAGFREENALVRDIASERRLLEQDFAA